MTLEEAKERLQELLETNKRYLSQITDDKTDFIYRADEMCKDLLAIDTVLKEIKIQEKIIHEYNEYFDYMHENWMPKSYIEENYIPKDKLREKIKDLQENNNGDDYNLANVVNILKDL